MQKTYTQLVKYHDKFLKHGLIRFLVVGTVGFVVNFVCLTLFFHILKLPILISQLMGAEIALFFTFTGNNWWAFRGDHHHSLMQKLVRYHMSSWVGLGLNSLCVVVLVKYAGWYYGFALVVGAAIGLIWNYTLNRRVVFLHKNSPAKPEEA